LFYSPFFCPGCFIREPVLLALSMVRRMLPQRVHISGMTSFMAGSKSFTPYTPESIAGVGFSGLT